MRGWDATPKSIDKYMQRLSSQKLSVYFDFSPLSLDRLFLQVGRYSPSHQHHLGNSTTEYLEISRVVAPAWSFYYTHLDHFIMSRHSTSTQNKTSKPAMENTQLLSTPTFIIWNRTAGLVFVSNNIKEYMEIDADEGENDDHLPAPPASYVSSFWVRKPVASKL